jgi:hypothetical protein
MKPIIKGAAAMQQVADWLEKLGSVNTHSGLPRTTSAFRSYPI